MRNTEFDRTVFDGLFIDIRSGALTRAEAAQRAAERTGCSPNTFLSWLRSSGRAAELKDVRLSAGANHKDSHAKNNPELEAAYQAAIREAQEGRKSVRQVALAYAGRGVSYQWLLHRLKKAPTTSAAAAAPSEATPEPA